eukprot:CAMPEP_0201546300 /NCGR_PEP_ID=MMETSP0173_2-20130828/2624_1 /ASSEMBLY_ACC=CAM_ASM_000268 /TAXON_ID=218659 /ORGANISM="Vexillifera sp., Strain DIVA3 564/2" /LENGTH=112 /DNA_ID=CAMNT_0047954925 /DNA_START=55 /DNA_END=393 /DNA_ORIENTATION=+
MSADNAAEKKDGPINYIRLESAEGHVFVVDEDAARASQTIAAMFAPEIKPIMEASGNPIQFNEIGTPILEKVIKYFYYKKKYSKVVTEKIPDFQIEPEIALELLMAANFLDA